MIRKVALTTLAALFCAAAELPLLERFDTADALSGNLLNEAAVEAELGLDKGALKAQGTGAVNVVIYNVMLPLTGGNNYAMSLNYRTEKMQNYAFRIDVLYESVKGKNESFNMIASNFRWMQKSFEFTAPEGATSATVRMRMVRAPEGSKLLVDNLKVEQLLPDVPGKIFIADFSTDFNGWCLDAHPVFDHFMPGPGGSIVKDAAQAKAGDSFFKAVGDNSKMQYALYIDNIKVNGNGNYVFQAAMKAADVYRQNANGMIIFFFKDAKGTAIGQSRFHIRPTGNEWKDIKHSFSVPEKCAFIDIGLNLRERTPEDAILLDCISFKQQ